MESWPYDLAQVENDDHEIDDGDNVRRTGIESGYIQTRRRGVPAMKIRRFIVTVPRTGLQIFAPGSKPTETTFSLSPMPRTRFQGFAASRVPRSRCVASRTSCYRATGSSIEDSPFWSRCHETRTRGRRRRNGEMMMGAGPATVADGG